MNFLDEFEKETGIRFRTVRALKSALAIPPPNGGEPWYRQEDLAYVGDAFLELVLREYLVEHFDDVTFRSGVVRSRAASNRLIGYVAQSCSLHKYATSRTEPGRADRRLGTLFEAIVGALRLDRGDRVARRFLGRVYLPHVLTLSLETWEEDPVTQVQLLIRSQYKTNVRFVSRGSSHGLIVVAATVFNREVLREKAPTFEEARQQAAATLLNRIMRNDVVIRR